MTTDFPYWQKQTISPLFPDLEWNTPEQKTGSLALIGGNSQNFSTIIKTAEFATNRLPLKSVHMLLPDALQGKLPPLADLTFAPSTDSGSFAPSSIITSTIDSVDFAILLGDLSRNSATAVAFANTFNDLIKQPTPTPLLLTRDAVDLLAPEANNLVLHPRLTLLASLAQLQKFFRALFYPKMLLLSMPLLPVIETLHKFTLSYPLTLATLHEANIIVAHQGQITTTLLSNTSYSPISLWSGQLAAKIAAHQLWNPKHPLEATTFALLA